MADDLGDRMKYYEGREASRNALPYLPVCARIDGKGFSKFTRSMTRPFEQALSDAMIATTKRLVELTQARIGYTQSDEINLVWQTEARNEQLLFDGKYQKLSSILASMTTATFYPIAARNWPKLVERMPPMFDARVWQVPNREEAANVFLWREIDATKNAISMATRAYYSHAAMMHKNASQMQEMLFQKGINFNDYPPFFKRGTFMRRVVRNVTLDAKALARIPEDRRPVGPVTRAFVEPIPMPSFRKVLNRAGVIFDGEDPNTLEREFPDAAGL